MGLKIRLEWFDKKTEFLEGKEYSTDLGDDGSIIEALGLIDEPEIYDGGFDVKADWAMKLQSLFSQKIELAKFDYQVSFRYERDL